MITKINKVKNLGIFRDYHWDANLEDFCRYNLIYGWNGCGKTTLSKLFTALELGKLDKYGTLEYEIQADTKKWKNDENFDERVRVFNKEYVLANVEKLGGPNPIFILGDENKQLAEQIEKDEKEIAGRSDALKISETQLADLETRKGNIFTDIARTISQNASGESTRSYRKPNAEADFAMVKQKELLNDEDMEAQKGTLAQQQKPTIDLLPDFSTLKPTIDGVIKDSKAILDTEVTSVVVDRLTHDTEISNWVEKGLAIHENHKSKNCEFCGQQLPEDRIKALAAHFNEADKALKEKIDEQLEKLRPIFATLRDLNIREASNLYDELQKEYKGSASAVTKARDGLIKQIELLGKEIADKKSKTTEKLSLNATVDTTSFETELKSVNKHIAKHNKKTENFEKEKDVAREKLKTHYFSEIFDDITKIDGELKIKQSEVEKIKNGDKDDADSLSISDLKTRVNESRSKISSSHKACKEINDRLEKFLGRKELIFEVSGEGYVIKRHDEVADDLSEGERTAIAFVYFTVQLMDQNFNLKDGIVVIDDPISSLDSNSLFQAFAFMKESVKDAKQVFILTHNFEFMRQVKNWFFHIKKVGGKLQRSLYMINNKEVDNKRVAFIAPLDKLLMEYESEYHYLFSLLHNFQEDGSLESVYNFPNIGRKFLETFLAFKIPSNENIHNKMSHIDYNDGEKTAILRFVETHSHAERSDGVLNFDMTLSNGGQTAIASLMKMIKQIDETHYTTLADSCETT